METVASQLNTTEVLKFGTPTKSVDPIHISKVKVIVRVRPFIPREIYARSGNPKSCVSVLDQNYGDSNEVAVQLKDPDTSRQECYKLDKFFGQEDDNVSQIFYREVNPLISEIFRGCNATVFAYGATGSGKTYTMQGTEEFPGLMTLAMSTILSLCQQTGSTAEISYYEVYMDRCYDLLEVKEKEITIFDDKDGQVHLRGLSSVGVNSMTEFKEVFACGVQRRKVAHTGLNDVSSRSHGVLVISVSYSSEDGSGTVVSGKINLIDLAGNEDNRKTCNESIRLQESVKINQSLFALSNVIYALNNNKPRVPYRESKLTRILQDSLGGTSRALMVACLNPGEYQESVYTVSLAARSRQISNYVSSSQKMTPNVKVDMKAKLQAWLDSKGKTKSAHRIVHGSPYVSKTPFSLSSVKKSNRPYTAQAKSTTKRGSSKDEERTIFVPFKNLFSNDDMMESPFEDSHLVVENKNEKMSASGDRLGIESAAYLPDAKDGSSLINEEKTALQTPSRKALSSINTNVDKKPLDELPFELKTPKTRLTVTCPNSSQSPAHKFGAWSSNLKTSLIQEYVNFLNTASREELLELKGVGQKMAEYIIALRETHPLRSINDLEGIGLSSKQIHNMFSLAARGIFDKREV